MKMGHHCPFCRAKIPTSDEDQVKYIRPWVKKKKAWAQNDMAQKYLLGRGVKRSYEMARMLYELAAQQGNAGAMSNLGTMYETGRGVEQSYERAAEYYDQAAQLGLADAQYNLGCMYKDGTGVKQSFLMAKELYELAIEQGYVEAIVGLGVLYANGSGVEKDIAKARNLFIKAEALGNETATTYLKILDDSERKDAALDPSSIVCSMCGLPQTPTRSFSKMKCPCKSTWYCNTKCQKKHWKMHRNDCQRLIAEIKRKKKMTAEELQRGRNAVDTVSTTTASTIVEEDISGALPKKEEVNDGKENTKRTREEEEEDK
jgi:TPR repeat protein